MANVAGVSNTVVQDTYTQERTPVQELGKDQFLQILVAQMTYQDPMNPTNDTEFVSQMAQFSVLEQLQQLNSVMTASQAYNLLGKYVYVTDVVDGQESLTLGKVTGVVNDEGVSKLIIGDSKYEVSKVFGVADVTEPTTSLEEMIAQGASLIGKQVEGSYTGEDGKEVAVTGMVDKIIIKDGGVYAKVGEDTIPLASITEVTA